MAPMEGKVTHIHTAIHTKENKMKTAFVTTAALVPTGAMAHAGQHTGSLLQTVIHFASQPDHWLAMGVIGAVLTGLALSRWSRA